MKKEKQNSQQISLDALRLTKSGVTPGEIKKLKLQLRRNGLKVLKLKIKPVGRRKETKG